MSPLRSMRNSYARPLLFAVALGACSDALVLKTEEARRMLVEDDVGAASAPMSADAGQGGLRPEVARAAMLTEGISGDLTVIAGEWTGETTGFAFESGSTKLHLVIGPSSGHLKFGRGSAPLPPRNPTDAYPADWYARSFSNSPFNGVYEGFAYPLRVLAVAPSFERLGLNTPVTLRANKRDLFAEWCALQVPLPSPASGALACSIPGIAHDVESDQCGELFEAWLADVGVDTYFNSDAGLEAPACPSSPDRPPAERQCNIYDDRDYLARHGVNGDEVLLGTVPCVQHGICHYACPTCNARGCPIIDDQDLQLDLELNDGILVGWLRMTFEWFGYGYSPDYPQPNLSPSTIPVRLERVLELPR